MTTTDAPTIPVLAGADLLDAARTHGPELAARARTHDLDGTFVEEAFEVLRRTGYLASPVPIELGGGGATTEEVAWAQCELARSCGSSALATTMHLHVVLTNAWRWRHGLPGAESLLRNVAAGQVVASTGGGDFTHPSGTARSVGGGWLVSGRKSFVSGAPAADLASTWAVTEDGEAIGFGFRLDEPGVTVEPTWDAPGMRGTASHDLVLDGLFLAHERVTARRVPGQFAPVLAILGAKALTVIAATYLGVALGARDEVLRRISSTARSNDDGVRRTIGLIDHHTRAARWALDSVLRSFGEDPEPDQQALVTSALVKRTVIEHARTVGDLAMDVMGGRVYRRGDFVERAWRDLRAGPYHPLDHELTLRLAGDLALERPLAFH